LEQVWLKAFPPNLNLSILVPEKQSTKVTMKIKKNKNKMEIKTNKK
jgi:hypothetical protein